MILMFLGDLSWEKKRDIIINEKVLISLEDRAYIISYLPTPPLGQDMTQGQFFKRSLTGLNSEFSFS